MTDRSLVFAALVLALHVVGCASDVGDVQMDVVFDPCNTRVAPGPDAAPHEIEAIDRALLLWNEAAGLDLRRDGDAPALEVGFVPTLPALFGVYDDEEGVITINRNIADASAREIVIAHEVGHAFGLFHVVGEASLMNPGNTNVAPTPADVERLRGLWNRCSASDYRD